MKPREADRALEAASGVDVNDAAVDAWLAERVSHAREHRKERVRVPLVRRGALGCDCPLWAIGSSPRADTLRWVHVVDLTSAGLPTRTEGWSGWAEGRFTGATESYHGGDAGTDAVVPVLEVVYGTERAIDEPPIARAVAD